MDDDVSDGDACRICALLAPYMRAFGRSVQEGCTLSHEQNCLMHTKVRPALGKTTLLSTSLFWYKQGTLSHVYYKAVLANIDKFLRSFPKTEKPSESRKQCLADTMVNH